MRRLLLIAARNVFRNRRRSLISALAIVVGVGASVFLRGIVNGFIANVLEDTVRGKVGALQIHRAGYRQADNDPRAMAFARDPALEERVRAVAGVVAVAPRLSFEGMISNGAVSTMFMATAIEPRLEYAVCPIRRQNVQAGGQPLDDTTETAAIVGRTLADFLEAGPGASLTLSSATAGGATNALDVTVRGYLPPRFLFESKRLVTVTLAFAQSLLKMEGRVTEYAIAVADLERVEEVAARVRAAVGPGWEVETWAQLAPVQRDMVGRVSVVLRFIVGILALLVATGIANTMLMSVYERVREIGTMMAVGVRRRQVMALFLAEACVLGLVGSVVGASLGLAGVLRLGQQGVRFRPPGGDPTTIVPYISPSFVVLAVGLALLGTALAGLLPAWKASRLRPVEALRAN